MTTEWLVMRVTILVQQTSLARYLCRGIAASYLRIAASSEVHHPRSTILASKYVHSIGKSPRKEAAIHSPN